MASFYLLSCMLWLALSWRVEQDPLNISVALSLWSPLPSKFYPPWSPWTLSIISWIQGIDRLHLGSHFLHYCLETLPGSSQFWGSHHFFLFSKELPSLSPGIQCSKNNCFIYFFYLDFSGFWQGVCVCVVNPAPVILYLKRTFKISFEHVFDNIIVAIHFRKNGLHR